MTDAGVVEPVPETFRDTDLAGSDTIRVFERLMGPPTPGAAPLGARPLGLPCRLVVVPMAAKS